jgi:hypothetical protein
MVTDLRGVSQASAGVATTKVASQPELEKGGDTRAGCLPRSENRGVDLED